jgi:hypothetical protein
VSDLPLPDWMSYDVLLHDRCGRKLSEHPMPHAPGVSCPFPELPPREFAEVRLELGPPENLLYDAERGVLQTLVNDVVREEIEVRAQLADRALRMVIVEELRLLGYGVTEP